MSKRWLKISFCIETKIEHDEPHFEENFESFMLAYQKMVKLWLKISFCSETKIEH